MIFAKYIGHFSFSSISTFIKSDTFSLFSITLHSGSFKGLLNTAAASLAMPITESQSGLFGVALNSTTVSPVPTMLLISSPSGVSSGSTIMPLCSSVKPSSLSEQIIPKDSTPRSFASLILISPSTAPIFANGTI